MEENALNTDKALFERIGLGDEAAFTEIFFRYVSRLSPFVTQLLRSDSWTEEIVQDVFMRLWLNREQLQHIMHPAAYLYQMASNRTLDYIKRHSREVKLQYYVSRREGWVDHLNNTQEDLDFREIEGLVKEAVGQLSAQRKKVYQMVREEGLSHAVIAERLNISRHTVRNHVAEALQEIRSYLHQKGLIVVLLLTIWKK